MAQRFFIRKVRFSHISLVATFFILLFPFAALSQHSPKIPFPYGPMGLNSMPWIVAKEANLFEKNGINVEMIFVGVSTVMVQSMLSGSANVAGLGGPAVVSNVLRGGDIIQIAATVPYFTQSLMARPQITELAGPEREKNRDHQIRSGYRPRAARPLGAEQHEGRHHPADGRTCGDDGGAF